MNRLTQKGQSGGYYVKGDECYDIWGVPSKFMGDAIDRLTKNAYGGAVIKKLAEAYKGLGAATCKE